MYTSSRFSRLVLDVDAGRQAPRGHVDDRVDGVGAVGDGVGRGVRRVRGVVHLGAHFLGGHGLLLDGHLLRHRHGLRLLHGGLLSGGLLRCGLLRRGLLRGRLLRRLLMLKLRRCRMRGIFSRHCCVNWNLLKKRHTC